LARTEGLNNVKTLTGHIFPGDVITFLGARVIHSDFDSHFPHKKTFAAAMTGRRLIAKRSTRGGFPRSRVAGKGKLMLVRNLEPENVGPSLSEGKDLLSSTARCAL
jgi:hypothetical protein